MALVRSFIRFPTIVEFGEGKLDMVGDIAAKCGKKAYCIIDPVFRGTPFEERLLGALRGDHQIECVTNYGVIANPRASIMDEMAEECREKGCDLVISMGGGSCLDIGKAVAMLVTNGRHAWDYATVENHKYYEVEVQPLPHIVIPTTSGTGSEGTIYSVITNPEIKRKCTIRSFYLYPSYAIVDPDLMVGIPPMLTALTGIDTFAHAYESFTNRNATLYSRMVAFEAMRLFAENIETCVKNGSDRKARGEMAFASLLGGVAIAHSPTTIPHIIGQCLSGWVDAPHGGSLTCCLAHVIRWTVPEHAEDHARIARLFDRELQSADDVTAALALPDALDRLFERILPEKITMKTYGMDESRAEEFADFIFDNYQGDMANYMKKPTREDIRMLVRASM